MRIQQLGLIARKNWLSTILLDFKHFQAFSTFSFRIPLRVIASAANLEIPSLNFSTAIASSLKSKRNNASSLMYDFLGMSSDFASSAFSFCGMLSFEL